MAQIFIVMEKYILQLLTDIAEATTNLSMPFIEKDLQLQDWISDEDEERTAPVRNLEEWIGIYKEQLPPEEMLTDDQVHRLLEALIKMLDACNWSFVLQTQVPERIQYSAIRDNFNQQIKLKQWHKGFFVICRPGTAHGRCALGEHCQCAWYAELFSQFTDEDLSPEEERRRLLQIEVNHLKRKYEDDWMKYYPYHLDANYDDENGNFYNYGFEEDDNEDW